MNIEIVGSTGKISDVASLLDNISDLCGELQVGIQCVDARMVFSKLHSHGVYSKQS